MASSVVIRQAVLADFEQWLPLWNDYNAFYGRIGETVLASDITQTVWDRFLDDNEPMHALVAEIDGRLVGLAHYIFHRVTVSKASTCYMEDLFTAAEARGAGVARALINAVCDCARESKAGGVYWLTQETNSTARFLYDKVADHNGFIVYRVTQSDFDKT